MTAPAELLTRDALRSLFLQEMDRLMRHPLMRSYWRHGDSGEPLTRAEDALGQQWCLGVLALDEEASTFYSGIKGSVPQDIELQTRARVWDALRHSAQTILWRNEQATTAASLSVPEHRVPHDIVVRPQCWLSETGWGCNELPNEVTAGYFFEPYDGGWLYWLINQKREELAKRAIFRGWRVETGKAYPQEYEKAVGEVLAMLYFLESPYTSKVELPLDRKTQRALVKKKKRQPQPVITIHLRKRGGDTPKGHDKGAATGEGAREYSCSWIVNGHIRNQWYRSKQEHRPIWIAPYPKGPADKPFRHKVYRVDR